MVTTAFLLFTVSTLAAQINAVPTNNAAHDPCKGKTHCFEKPANYPQKKINRIVAQSDLHHFYRIKREAQLAFSNEKDECVESIKTGPLYRARDVNNITRNVVQSEYFSQEVALITCRTNKLCYSSLHIGKWQCEPTISRINLVMTAEGDTEAKAYETDIVTGCQCAKEKKKNQI